MEHEQIVELCRQRDEAQDREDQNRIVWSIVLGNQGLLRKISREVYRITSAKRRWNSYDDIFDSACLYAFKHTQNYRPDQFRYSTYVARFTRKNLIQEARRGCSVILLPYWVVGKSHQGHPDDYRKAAQALSVGSTDLMAEDLPAASPQAQGLDDIETREQWDLVQSRLKQLPANQREILDRYLGLNPAYPPANFRQIGCEFGYSSQWIRSIYCKTIRELQMAVGIQ